MSRVRIQKLGIQKLGRCGALGPLALALGFSIVALSAPAQAATPVGDEIFVSAYNMPTHFGRPVTVDDTDPLDLDIRWDPENGAGLPSTFGITANLPPLGGSVTINHQLTVGTRVVPWAGQAIDVQTPDNGVVSNTTFNKPGELVLFDFTRTNGQSLSNPATNFDPFGFLIEDVQWREGGVAETRPILVREDTFFFYFTKNGNLVPIPPALQSQVSVGAHPTGEVAQVIHAIDSVGDLSDPALFFEADEDELFDDGVAFFGVDPDGTEDFPIGLLEVLLSASPINDVHAGILVARAQYGDATLDDLVDGADYTVWADNYLQSDKAWQTGDFNNDGVVDGGDYTLWADHYNPGASLALTSAVPEPGTLTLAASGAALMAVVAFRRRRAK